LLASLIASGADVVDVVDSLVVVSRNVVSVVLVTAAAPLVVVAPRRVEVVAARVVVAVAGRVVVAVVVVVATGSLTCSWPVMLVWIVHE
jgi:hypothetical protein